jgi:hypothetical protein
MKYKLGDENGLKVKLTQDLTRYHKSLVVGAEGMTLGFIMMWSRNQPERFVTVKFKEITLDVLWKGLEPA